MENESENLEIGDKVPQVYELSYLITPTKSLEEAEGKAADLKSHMLSNGGTILNEGKPKIIDLAYPMAKIISNKRYVYENAYFGWVKVEIAKDRASLVKDTLDKDIDVIRFLIIKTKKDVPQLKRRQIRKPVVKKEEPKDVPQVDEEKLNKELEELLTT